MSYNGSWDIVMKTPMGDRNAKLTLAQDGDSLSGNMAADGNDTPITNGRVEEGRAKWDVEVTSPMPLTLSFDVADEDGGLAGSVQLGMFGTSTVTGTAS